MNKMKYSTMSLALVALFFTGCVEQDEVALIEPSYEGVSVATIGVYGTSDGRLISISGGNPHNSSGRSADLDAKLDHLADSLFRQQGSETLMSGFPSYVRASAKADTALSVVAEGVPEQIAARECVEGEMVKPDGDANQVADCLRVLAQYHSPQAVVVEQGLEFAKSALAETEASEIAQRTGAATERYLADSPYGCEPCMQSIQEHQPGLAALILKEYEAMDAAAERLLNR